jgi:hypothetical protein
MAHAVHRPEALGERQSGHPERPPHGQNLVTDAILEIARGMA